MTSNFTIFVLKTIVKLLLWKKIIFCIFNSLITLKILVNYIANNKVYNKNAVSIRCFRKVDVETVDPEEIWAKVI